MSAFFYAEAVSLVLSSPPSVVECLDLFEGDYFLQFFCGCSYFFSLFAWFHDTLHTSFLESYTREQHLILFEFPFFNIWLRVLSNVYAIFFLFLPITS